MKIEYYGYGQSKGSYKVNIYIVNEKEDEDLYIATYDIKSNIPTYRLRTNSQELNKIFDKAITSLTKEYNIEKINSYTNSIELEMIADCTQETSHGKNWLKLKFKLDN